MDRIVKLEELWFVVRHCLTFTDRARGAPVPGPTILQIIPQLDTGGAEISTLEIVEALVKAGATALVATEGGRLAERGRAARR